MDASDAKDAMFAAVPGAECFQHLPTLREETRHPAHDRQRKQVLSPMCRHCFPPWIRMRELTGKSVLGKSYSAHIKFAEFC